MVPQLFFCRADFFTHIFLAKVLLNHAAASNSFFLSFFGRMEGRPGPSSVCLQRPGKEEAERRDLRRKGKPETR
jgi:hypothetical protein